MDTPEDIPQTSGQRGSRALWLEAAKTAFLDRGLDAVKIQPLAADLNISRTSFYWFFKDRQAILDALLDHWDTRNTGALVDGCCAYADSLAEGVLNLLAVFLAETRFEPRLDFAIRGWAHQSGAVQARVAAADEARLDAIRDMFLRHGVAAGAADVRARTVYLVQIGYIAMQVTEPLDTRVSRIPDYVRTFAGVDPTDRELARFHAQLGYGRAGATA